MKHDIDYVIGEKYYIDERQNNKKAIVTLLRFQPMTKIFCTVKSIYGGNEWETMLGRLTEIPSDELGKDFQPCDDCDLPDACSDHECAIKAGLRTGIDI